MQNIADNNSSALAFKNQREKDKIYLKLISEATRVLSNNQGSYRRDIWQYLLDIYGVEEETIEYSDFLLAIKHLL